MLRKKRGKVNYYYRSLIHERYTYLKITPFCVSSAFHNANKYYSLIDALNYTLYMCVNFSETHNSREAAVEQNLHVW
jgi:hypothetical protein